MGVRSRKTAQKSIKVGAITQNVSLERGKGNCYRTHSQEADLRLQDWYAGILLRFSSGITLMRKLRKQDETEQLNCDKRGSS